MNFKISMSSFFLVYALLLPSLLSAAIEKKPVIDVVKSCDNKYAGEDQNTIFSVSIKNKRGKVKRTIYQRYWKFQQNGQNSSDKLSLFTLSPPDAKDTAFLQHTFSPSQGKNAEQWLYLPSLRNIRRTTIRDPNDSFLGTDLSFDDIRLRGINEDQHRLLNVRENNTAIEYLVESRPKEATSIYSRKVIVYEENKKNGDCLKRQISYYNKNNALVKNQLFQWQKIANAWLWKTVVVKNAQTFSTSTFQISRAKVNTHLEDKFFTTRMLKRGIH